MPALSSLSRLPATIHSRVILGGVYPGRLRYPFGWRRQHRPSYIACAVGPVIKRVVPELADSEGAMNRFVEKCLHRPSDIWVSAFHPQVRI